MIKKNHKKIAQEVILTEIEGLKKLYRGIDNSFNKAVELILKTDGKIIFCGIGKSGIVANKAAKTFSSVGTPSVYIHASEFSHGDAGAIQKRDIMVIFSSSGETKELKDSIQFANRWGIPLIGVASKKNSLLLNASDIKILLPFSKEAGIGSIIPTTSTTMFMTLADALAIAVMNKKKFGLYDFKKLHPGGKIGKVLTYVEDLMIKDKKKIPFVDENKKVSESLKIMNKKKLGTLVVLNKKRHCIGLVQDGDIRRHSKIDLKNLKVKDIMTKNPISTEKTTLAVKCLEIMQNKKITKIIVTANKVKKNAIKVIGIITIHNILQAGIK